MDEREEGEIPASEELKEENFVCDWDLSEDLDKKNPSIKIKVAMIPELVDDIESPLPPDQQHLDPIKSRKDPCGWKQVGNQFICLVEGCHTLAFTAITSLRRHWEVVHKPVTLKFSCPEGSCPVTTNRPWDMSRHLAKSHQLSKEEISLREKKRYRTINCRNRGYISPGFVVGPSQQRAVKTKPVTEVPTIKENPAKKPKMQMLTAISLPTSTNPPIDTASENDPRSLAKRNQTPPMKKISSSLSVIKDTSRILTSSPVNIPTNFTPKHELLRKACDAKIKKEKWAREEALSRERYHGSEARELRTQNEHLRGLLKKERELRQTLELKVLALEAENTSLKNAKVDPKIQKFLELAKEFGKL